MSLLKSTWVFLTGGGGGESNADRITTDIEACIGKSRELLFRKQAEYADHNEELRRLEREGRFDEAREESRAVATIKSSMRAISGGIASLEVLQVSAASAMTAIERRALMRRVNGLLEEASGDLEGDNEMVQTFGRSTEALRLSASMIEDATASAVEVDEEAVMSAGADEALAAARMANAYEIITEIDALATTIGRGLPATDLKVAAALARSS
jgi:hypothetical protein